MDKQKPTAIEGEKVVIALPDDTELKKNELCTIFGVSVNTLSLTIQLSGLPTSWRRYPKSLILDRIVPARKMFESGATSEEVKAHFATYPKIGDASDEEETEEESVETEDPFAEIKQAVDRTIYQVIFTQTGLNAEKLQEMIFRAMLEHRRQGTFARAFSSENLQAKIMKRMVPPSTNDFKTLPPGEEGNE